MDTVNILRCMERTGNERMKMFAELMQGPTTVFDISSKALAERLLEFGYFSAPASTRYHGAYEGGLFDHSYAVTMNLLRLTERLGLTWEREISPYYVGMLHDLCKCGQYAKDPDAPGWTCNKDLIIPGHGERSVILAQELLNLTDEEMVCIRWHMGAFDDKEHWNSYGRAIEKYPNVLWTHTADMMASRIDGV